MDAAWVMNTLSIIFIFLFVGLAVFAVQALLKYIGSKDRGQGQPEPGRWLGKALRQRRISCNMTQEFVAEAMGVSRETILKWESGAADPSVTDLLALARLFQTPPEDLIRPVRAQSLSDDMEGADPSSRL